MMSSALKAVARGALSAASAAPRRHMSGMPAMHGTTILSVRKDGKVAVLGDGQVSLGSTIVKPNAKKVRLIGDDIIAGFAGSTADAMTLLERLERKLEEHPGQMTRACVELAKNWRTDKYLRKLEAVLLVSDGDISLTLTGNGDVLEPPDGLIGVGSGGTYALAAARALIDRPDMDALEIAKRSMDIASGICVYTNGNYTIETLGYEDNAANRRDNKVGPWTINHAEE